MSDADVVSYVEVYRSDVRGPVHDRSITWESLGSGFEHRAEALAAAAGLLTEGYSVFLELNAMPRAEWDALEDSAPPHVPTAPDADLGAVE